MREVVYLSRGKLRQFLPEPRRAPRAGALRLTTPLGGVDVDAPAADGEQDQMRHLQRVQKHLERSAAWYEEPGLRPGQWVQFEADLRCVTLRGDYSSLVLFVDSGSADGGACRLLMHGSVHHLLGLTPEPTTGPALERCTGGGEDSGGETFLTKAGEVVRQLTAPAPHADGSEPLSPAPLAPTLSSHGIRVLLAALDAGRGDIDASAPMIGYARVTALLPERNGAPRCLVASPLTVEYSQQA
ncbi:SAVMC3_10250 family protein [Streptomyces sp. NPDC015232]|uniref:SAVMC3_10250 family protein n=1 Tax=unclassified Streptomyces TaxID=2593676 RepID=UPI0036FB0245